MATAVTNHFDILVVDDDEDFSDLLARYLRKIPHAAISLVHNIGEAVEALSHKHFDLIVSDWMLDKGNSPEIFDRVDKLISADAEKQPILFMSSADRLGAMHELGSYSHFEPKSFILKRFGPPLISLLAENTLTEGEDDGRAKRYGAFQADIAEN